MREPRDLRSSAGEILIYEAIGEEFWDGNGVAVRDVMNSLSLAGPGPLTVRINSMGGLVFEGLAIFNALKAHAGPVTVIVDAIAASSASLIAMAGETIIMREGAMMMIHDPATITWGNAEVHERSAEQLNRLADNFAAIYARRSGQDAETVRALMRAETWMTADETVKEGFATRAEGASLQPVAFDWRQYRNAPPALVAMSTLPPQRRPAAKTEEIAMTIQTPAGGHAVAADTPVVHMNATAALNPAPVVAQAPKPVAEPVASVAEIRALVASVRLPDSVALDLAEKGLTMNAARAQVLERLAATQSAPIVNATVVADGVDRFVEGATRALLAKAGMQGGERNEFSSLMLRELARMSLDKRGLKATSPDLLQMVGTAFNPTMAGGMHTRSDFANVLSNVANKAMLTGFEEAGETFQQWTSTGSAPDFKAMSRVDLNLYPSLATVAEGEEYGLATMGDRGVTVQVAKYGNRFAITREAIINDDLAAFTAVPRKMGRAAIRTIGNLVYAVLSTNPTFAGQTLFHADRTNLFTSAALSVTNLDAAISAMMIVRDPDAHATGGLGIMPRYLIVPPQLRGLATVVTESEFDPAATQRVPNRVRGMVVPIADARLSAAAATWYLAADPAQVDTIEVTYLNGVTTPTLEQREGWNVDGVEFKVRMEAGVNILDWRGLSRSVA